ncbi:hypothetical protein BI292_13450 [Pseudomonas sp. 43NM1]|nr:hypothetical protein BI292_13450 [Pseudomonas sp. 43NM1]
MITIPPLSLCPAAMTIAISQKPTFGTMAASAQKATIQTLMRVQLPSALCNDMELGNKRS